MPEMPTEVQLPGRLEALVKSCERNCVHECCGIDAYDFSPLHIAAHISSYTGVIRESDIAEIQKEIDDLLQQVLAMPRTSALPDEFKDYLCFIKGMNHWFSAKTLNKFAEELKYNMKVAIQVLELSDKLRFECG